LWLAPPGQGAINQAPTKSIQPADALTSITQESVDGKSRGPGDPKGRPYISGKERTRVSALHLGIMIGCGSLIYFGMNAWIASYNQALHHAGLTPLALAILNVAQLPSSLLVTLLAQQLAGRRWPFIVAGAICAVSISGWIFTPASLEVLWAALLGGSSALVFTLGLALPPLLARHDEVARLTGISFSLTYGVAFVGPFIGGELWDLFHLPAVAFVPVAAASVTLIILGSLLPSRATFGLIERPGKPEKQAVSRQ
jgi:MFS transporter, CP family, cyanate transporter